MPENPIDRIRRREFEAKKALESEARKTLSLTIKGKEHKDIYSKIREEKAKEILETGKKWILISPNGIPVAQATTEEVIMALKYVSEASPSSLKDVRVKDVLLDGKTYTGTEFLREHEFRK